MVAFLAHEDCPVSGEIYAAGAGRFARIFIASTQGYVHAAAEPTIEDVAEHWATINDETGYYVPADLNAWSAAFMAHLFPSDLNPISILEVLLDDGERLLVAAADTERALQRDELRHAGHGDEHHLGRDPGRQRSACREDRRDRVELHGPEAFGVARHLGAYRLAVVGERGELEVEHRTAAVGHRAPDRAERRLGLDRPFEAPKPSSARRRNTSRKRSSIVRK